MRIIRALYIACFLAFSLYPFSLYAEIIINEVHPTEEYLEIKNISNENIDLSGFTWSEKTSSGTEKFYSFEAENIEANEIVVIEFSSKINNTGDEVSLYTSNNDLIETIEIPSAEDNKSYSRDSSGTFYWATASKGTENPEQPSYSSEIEISEMLPNPDGDDSIGEFIEIYNNSSENIALSGWSLKDDAGKSYFFDDIEILANQYLVFYRDQTGITLNNTAEVLVLKNPNGENISELSFTSSASSGHSIIRYNNSIRWTNTPTPENENIYIAPENNSIGGNTYQLFEGDSFLLQSPREKSPQILITEVSANAKNDFIEAYCKECQMDLEGIRIGLDGEVFRIPPETFVETGQILVFEFGYESQKEHKIKEKTSYGWKFFVPYKGITKTDETVYIGDEKSHIIDALCFANQSGTFSSGEGSDVSLLTRKNAWKKPVRESSCINSKFFYRNKTIKRKSFLDTNSKADFYISHLPSEGLFITKENTYQTSDKLGKIKISGIQIQENHWSITIKNNSMESVSLENFFIVLPRKTKKIYWIAQQEMVLPHGEIKVSIPVKHTSENAFSAQLYSRNSELIDFFCLGKESSLRESKSKPEIVNAYLQGISRSPILSECYSFPDQNGVFKRKNYHEKVSLQSYDFIPYSLDKIKPLEILKPQIKEETPIENKKETLQTKTQKNNTKKPNIEWVKPNPKGKDYKNEIIKIKNPYNHSLWTRNNSIIINGKTKPLPDMFFEAHQGKNIISPSPLKNSNTEVIFSFNNQLTSAISWQKAREEEYFGPLSPSYTPVIKKKKSTLLKKSYQKKNIYLLTEKRIKNYIKKIRKKLTLFFNKIDKYRIESNEKTQLSLFNKKNTFIQKSYFSNQSIIFFIVQIFLFILLLNIFCYKIIFYQTKKMI